MRVKIRDADSRMVKNKAVYVTLGVSRDGAREVLGLWFAEIEGAKFWLSVMNETLKGILRCFSGKESINIVQCAKSHCVSSLAGRTADMRQHEHIFVIS